MRVYKIIDENQVITFEKAYSQALGSFNSQRAAFKKKRDLINSTGKEKLATTDDTRKE